MARSLGGDDFAKLFSERSEEGLAKASRLAETRLGNLRSSEALLRLAAIRFAQGSMDGDAVLLTSAFELLAEADSLGAPASIVEFNRGVVLMSLGLARGAKEAFTRVLDLEPNTAWAAEAGQRIRELESRTRGPWPLPAGWEERASCEELFEYSLDGVLADWLVATEGGDTARADTLLGDLRGVGTRVAERCGDETIARLVREMESLPGGAPGWPALLAGKRLRDLWIEPDEARDHFSRMLRESPSSVLAGWAEFGLIHLDFTGDPEIEPRIERQLERLGDSRQPLLRGRLLWALGLARTRLELHDSSHAAYAAGLEELESAGYRAIASAVRNLMAENLGVMGFHSKAANLRAQGLRELRRAIWPPSLHDTRTVNLHNALVTGARDAARAGQAAMMEAMIREAHLQAAELGDPALEAELLIWRARSLQLLDRGNLALEPLREATKLASRLPHEDEDRMFLLCAAELGQLEGSPPPANVLGRLATVREECSKREILVARGWRLEASARLAESDLLGATAALEEALRRVRLALDGNDEDLKLRIWEESQQVFDLGIAIAAAMGRWEEALFLLEEARSPVGFSRATFGRELAQRRSTSAVLVLGAVGEDVLWWLLRPGGDVSWGRRTGARSAISGDWGRGHWSSETVRRAAFEELLGPAFEKLSPSESVVIVPDRELLAVPYVALIEPSTGEALVESRAISLRVSLRHALATRDVVEPAPGQVLLVANPAVDPRFMAPLDGAERETAEAAVVWGGRAVSLVGERATLAEAEPWFETSSVVHLAMHAVRGSSPGEVSLVFAGDEGREDLVPLHRVVTDATRLLVLSACSTARLGRERTALSWPLQSSLTQSGVTVVATLWPIDDESTASFAALFHRRLAAGEPASTALADAQREWKSSDDRGFDWAAFQILGDVRFAPARTD